MKTPLISLKTIGIVLTITGFTLSSPAMSTPIYGNLSMSGTVSINGTDFLTATRFTGFQDVFVGAESALSGDYLGTSGSAVTLTPYTWNPPTASTPIDPLWIFMYDGITYSFDLDVLHVDYASPTGLLLSGVGTAHITGLGVDKLDTAGHWDFSAQTLGLSTFTYSASTIVPATPVPDGGATVAMLGAALLGMGLIGRKQGLLKTA